MTTSLNLKTSDWMTGLGDRCFLWLVWLLAWTAFVIAVIKCCNEYLGNPFTVAQSYDAATPPKYALFPDVIICTHDLRENATDPAKMLFGGQLPAWEKKKREDESWASFPSPSKATPGDFVVDCFVKNYYVNIEGKYFSCRDYVKPFFHSMYKQCVKMLIPNDLREIAGKSVAANVGIRLTLFLDINPPSMSSEYTGVSTHKSKLSLLPPISKPEQPSSLAGVKVGLQASQEDWLSDITWTHTPPGGHSVSIDFKKLHIVKLSDSRSVFCREGNSSINDIQNATSSKSCRKFVLYNVETQKTKFPTNAFGPTFLSKLYLDSKNSKNETISYFHHRLKNLVETERVEQIYRKFLHLHIFSRTVSTETRQEKTWYTKYKLISNIAGCLGMFLGFSLKETGCKMLNKAFLLGNFISAKLKRTHEVEIYTNYDAKL